MYLYVKVIFLDISDGGRAYPAYNGYRTSVFFGVPLTDYSFKGKIGDYGFNTALNSSGTFEGFNEPLEFNTYIYGYLSFSSMHPKLKYFMSKNNAFIICEADRIVGQGTIIKTKKIDKTVL